MRRALIGVAAIAALAFFGISLRIHRPEASRRAERAGQARRRAARRHATMADYPPLAAPHRLVERRGSLEQRLRRLRGRPVVVNAWASWCAPCREELPLLGAAAAAAPRAGASHSSAPTSKTKPRRPRAACEPPVSYPSYPVDGGA